MRLFCIVAALLTLVVDAQGQTIEVFPVTIDEGVRVRDIRAVLCDSRGILWVGTYGDGLLYRRNGRFVSPAGADKITGPYILDICEVDDGSVMIRSERGFTSFDGTRWESMPGPAGSCPSDTETMLIDGKRVLDSLEAGVGTVFYATVNGLFSKGILDEQPGRVDDPSGMLGDTIQSLTFDDANGLWIGTRNNGLLRRAITDKLKCAMVSEQWRQMQYDTTTGLVLANVGGGVIEEWHPDTGLVVAYQLPGLIRSYLPYDSRTFVVNIVDGRLLMLTRDSSAMKRELHQSIEVSKMYQDRFGTVWIFDRDGNVRKLEKVEGGHRLNSTYFRTQGKDIVDFFPDVQNVPTIVGTNEIGEIFGSQYRRLAFSDKSVTAACKGDDGRIWIGRSDGSIAYFDKNVGLKRIGAPGNGRSIRFVVAEGNTLFLADDMTVYRLRLGNERDAIADLAVILKGPAAGMQEFAYKNGRLYFRSGTELCVHDLLGSGYRNSRPALFLTDVMLSTGSIAKSEMGSSVGPFMNQLAPVSLPFSLNDIVFSWEGMSGQPGEISYEYRLRDSDEWISIESRSQIQLVSLSPGAYQFQVRGCDATFNCTTLEPWVFIIEKPIWHHWWFWTLSAGVFLLLIFAIVKRRISQIKVEAQRKVELANAQRMAIELQQKARQLQMRPHFISNALNAIQSRVVKGDSQSAANDLAQFAQMMRAMLNASDLERVSLDDELELIRQYVAVTKLATGKDNRLEVLVGPDVELFDIEIPPMLIQPIIENAIEHGGPEIKLQVTERRGFVTIEVSDNGPGLSESDMSKPGSVAMKLVRQRLAAIGGRMIISNRDTGGAIVTLTIPIGK